ncbi:MAG: PhnD/SsuA/transferrin family substrate-binding protein [Coriobacteriales bacterium]|jgi:NitT/TauT family transport system substrate-binding protein|nr:PhnD/SsuA/transferrin family substrate-binding protein [Coriobacteriales bacterium]
MRAKIVRLALVFVLIGATLLSGCQAPGTDTEGTEGTGTGGARRVVVGTMVTEDLLPLWAAEQDGILTGDDFIVEIQVFQSAQELSTAIAAGEIDFAMTDPLVAANLTAGGTPVTLEWVTLGATPAQGRFGIMASPESGITSLKDLAGVPIGVGSNTMLEYVMDSVLIDAGVPVNQIKKEEIKKIPVRYEMMASNQVAAAVLPATMLYLGESSGMVLIADDTKGKNLSQSVMVSRSAFTETPEGQEALAFVKQAWDTSAAQINKNPESYRALLVEKCSLPDPIADSYPVSDYPLAQRPGAETLDPLLAWMEEKGYLEQPLSYDPKTGEFRKDETTGN